MTPPPPTSSEDRHLTSKQKSDISTDMHGATDGPPVIMAAAPSDKEAVCYEGELAGALVDMGCDVEIDNAKKSAFAPQTPKGVEVTVKETTVRPIHSSRIVSAFRRAGVAIRTRIKGSRKSSTTLYVTVGPK
jgi:hypothetical protein